MSANAYIAEPPTLFLTDADVERVIAAVRDVLAEA